ncbi:MAG: type II secretion system minor pseudopilin GspJ [Maricaulaceae bacterium]
MKTAKTKHTATVDAGFTLVEMLISLFIFSLLSVASMTVLSSTLRNKTQMQERVEGIEMLETARALIKSDMMNLVLRRGRDAYGTPDVYLLSGGAETLLTFTRGGRENPGGLERRGDLQRVSYVFENGALKRRSFVHENPAPQTKLQERILVSDLNSIRIDFLAGEQLSPQIFISKKQDLNLLNAIKLTMNFENGDRLSQYFEVSI